MPLASTFSPENVQAERGERVDREAGVGALCFDAVAHLGCGFVGEGECQDVFRFCSLVYQVQDFFCYHSCFAGTGAGEVELEAFAGVDGFGLRGVEGHG